MNLRLSTTAAFVCEQGGAVLFVSLVFLLILSFLAIATVNFSLTEIKMAGAVRNMQLAQLAAESAMNEAEEKIARTASVYGASQVCSHISCAVRGMASPFDAASFMHSPPAMAAMTRFRVDLSKLQSGDKSGRLAASPTYVIEDLGTQKQTPMVPASRNFWITARGVGETANFVKIIENVYSIPTHDASH